MGARFVEAGAISTGISGICSWYWLVRSDELYWSPQLCELYGLDAPPEGADDYLQLIHPADRARVASDRLRFIAEGDGFDHEFRIVRPAGEIRTIVDRGRTIRDSKGGALRLEGVNIDVTDLRHDAAIRQSAERRAAFAARIGGLVTWEIDPGSGRIVAEDGLPRLFGIAGAAPEFMSAYVARIHPDDLAQVLASFDRAKAPGGRYDAVYRVHVGEQWRWLRGSGECIEVDGGLRVVGFNIDVTEERSVRDQLDAVAREMAHRVKNTLAMVQALARQTFRNCKADEAASFEGRLQALARSQDLVAKRANQPASLAELVDAVLLRPLAMGSRITVSGPDVPLASKLSLALALVLHELMTNALKYGALSVESGCVELTWRLVAPASNVEMEWRERDGPPVTPPTRQGFGSRLVKRVLGGDLRGSAEVDYAPAGLQCRLAFPLAQAS